jgi:glycosyltransferase involved in cell wall biosynthesis
MKILFVHNFYGSSAPSGENFVYETEIAMLRQHGHTVLEYTRHSDDIRKQGLWGLIKGGFATPWNPVAFREVRKLVLKERPDILHVHNTFPLISPAIFWATAKTQTATVFTLHNYRIYCGSATLMRDGQPCHKCLDSKSPFLALYHRCYRKSFFATIPMAIKIASHRILNTFNKHVDRVIALTDFQGQMMVGAGINKELIAIKPHFLMDPPHPIPWQEREKKIVFVGRLSQEKGVHILVKAWEIWGKSAPKLEIIGDGPDRHMLENMVQQANLGEKILFLGQISHKEVLSKMSLAKLLVLPSICYEGFPMVICEAFGLGLPVAACDHGAMGSIIEDGMSGCLFEADSARQLEAKARSLWLDENLLSTMAYGARSQFDRQYSSKSNYDRLIEIYTNACEKRQRN